MLVRYSWAWSTVLLIVTTLKFVYVCAHAHVRVRTCNVAGAHTPSWQRDLSYFQGRAIFPFLERCHLTAVYIVEFVSYYSWQNDAQNSFSFCQQFIFAMQIDFFASGSSHGTQHITGKGCVLLPPKIPIFDWLTRILLTKPVMRSVKLASAHIALHK